MIHRHTCGLPWQTELDWLLLPSPQPEFPFPRSLQPDFGRSLRAWQPKCQAAGPPLTLQVLSSPGQEIVEDVEGPLLLGLADSTRFLQEIFANIEELCEPEGRQPSMLLYSRQKPLNFTRCEEWHKMAE